MKEKSPPFFLFYSFLYAGIQYKPLIFGFLANSCMPSAILANPASTVCLNSLPADVST